MTRRHLFQTLTAAICASAMEAFHVAPITDVVLRELSLQERFELAIVDAWEDRDRMQYFKAAGYKIIYNS